MCPCYSAGMATEPARLRKKMRQVLALKNSQWSPELLTELARVLDVAASKPVVSVSAPIERERTLHPAAKYLRRISTWTLFLGVARMMPPGLFWWQMVFIWLAGFAFIADVFFEAWRPLTKFVVIVVVVLAEVGYSVANGVLEKVPKIQAQISGLRVGSGNATGCTTYQVAIPVGTELDRLSLKLQFPMDVADFKVGTATESPKGRMAMAVVGSTPNGECKLVQSVTVDTPGIYGTLSGPSIVRIVARDVSKDLTVFGVFVLSKTKRSFSPPVEFSAEGSYEFRQLGRGMLSEPLTFIDQGVRDAK